MGSQALTQLEDFIRNRNSRFNIQKLANTIIYHDKSLQSLVVDKLSKAEFRQNFADLLIDGWEPKLALDLSDDSGIE